jgi:hypothetical protein
VGITLLYEYYVGLRHFLGYTEWKPPFLLI